MIVRVGASVQLQDVTEVKLHRVCVFESFRKFKYFDDSEQEIDLGVSY